MSPYEPVESPDETTIFSYHSLTPPTTREIYEAQRIVRRYLPRTPLVRSESLSADLDADVYLKREDVLPTGSFKIRGFYNLVANLNREFRERGLITSSMGNHGQGMATAAREFDVSAVVVVPETLENPTKIDGMKRLGATVVRHGQDVDEAREHAEREAAEKGYRYVHGGNEPHLIAGRASAGLEVMEDCPDVDVVINPVGGGSSAAAYALTVSKLLGADVVGVQAAGADAVYRAWSEGIIELQDRADTFAEGIKTRTPFALPLGIMREHLTEMVLVEDDDLRAAIRQLLVDDSVLAEGAAATSVAAALQLGDTLAGKTVVLPISGSNLSAEKLREILANR
ncbi:threonine ammonia-lyase [Halegenticoccus tardaugens]|uniref:threonine ammonia-lyase n=1 Tax=Halegenticoccus tardaugens TaxID=2071624 RepID=UPI00100BACCD|nr:threonine/serine dehydratase [Halegenticoccus tardaugens]